MYEQRRLIQYWFDNYPASEQKELSSRITSNDDGLLDSAFFEMFLYNLLCRLGCQIAIHPSTESDHNRTPDFLITTSAGDQFYLEAKVGTDRSQKEASQERLLSELVDSINSFHCPDFFICLEIIDPPLNPIPRHHIHRFIDELIKDTDPQKLVNQLLDDSCQITWPIFDQGGARIEFSLLPRYDKTPGSNSNRSTGSIMEKTTTIDPRARILNVIKKKANKYKNLKLPYVVALNASMWGLAPIDVDATIFGPGGLFLGKNSWDAIQQGRCKSHHTRVSAIWFSKRLSLDNLFSAQICQYVNPWPVRPLKTDFKEFGRASLSASAAVAYRDGDLLGPLLGIPDGWPV